MMSDIRFRMAKPNDAKQIAECHWHVRDRYTRGVFLSLGKNFLTAYYRITLSDPYEVVVCAEREDGIIVGFSSATLDAEKQAENLRNHKLKLGLAAVGALLKRPFLLKELWSRYKSLEADDRAPKFIHNKGVRGEYWCWRKDMSEKSFLSVDMENVKDGIIYNLGYREIFFEVDKFNKSVYRYHEKVAKAEPIGSMTLPDGRERVLFRKILKPYKKYGLVTTDK